jgi:transcription termination/antitermination protein NusA
MTKEIVEAVQALEREKGIASEKLMLALEDALLSAYKKTPDAAKYARVDMDRFTGDFRVFELILPPELEEKLVKEAIEEEQTVDPETGEMREPEEPEIDLEKLAEYQDQISTRDVTPTDFGRIAAQTAKQVILQRVREAERDMMFQEYRDRVGEMITGIIQQSDSRYTLVQLRERVEALLPKSEQVENERYDHGMRVKAVITEVSGSTKGPSIIVSRRNPELIKKLFELEVPEVADGLVEIVNVAREPGYRSKIAVVSHTDGVDPVGACVGPRGSRVRMVVSELRGEKIDIIPHNDEPARFVAKALSPARVREVLVDDENKQATVVVPDDQLSLAIGKEGQNARLAARLTGWRVDIKSESEFAEEEQELGLQPEEDMTGRCHAVLATGKRCPNAALPGSRYCGLPAHQALAEREEAGEEAGDAEPVEASGQAEAVEAAAAPAEAAAEMPEPPAPETGEAAEVLEPAAPESGEADAVEAAGTPAEAEPEPEEAEPSSDQPEPTPAMDDSQAATAAEPAADDAGLGAADQAESVSGSVTAQGGPAAAPVVEQAPPDTADEDSNEPDER